MRSWIVLDQFPASSSSIPWHETDLHLPVLLLIPSVVADACNTFLVVLKFLLIFEFVVLAFPISLEINKRE
jgi:hypothetical protein